MKNVKPIRYYRSLILLFTPVILFILLLLIDKDSSSLNINKTFPFLPWQFLGMALFGGIATVGGVLDWIYHRKVLRMKIPKKESLAHALALGVGGGPMFVLMWLATMSDNSNFYLIPIIVVLIFTVVGISYDEFIFHIKRCKKIETIYHRMLVFGNAIAWLFWIHFIYY